MIQVIVIGLIVVAIMGGVSYGVGKVKDAGRDEVRAEWAAANAKAKDAADADRKRQEAARSAQDVAATRRLADAQKRSRTLMVSLEAHIRAAGLNRDCRIPDSLLNDANDAITGGQGKRPGAVPSKPAAPTPTR